MILEIFTYVLIAVFGAVSVWAVLVDALRGFPEQPADDEGSDDFLNWWSIK